MRKVLIVVLVLLLGAGAGGVFYVGVQAEQRFDAALTRFSSPPSMVLKKVRYERSLLGAEAETALEISVGPQKIAIPFKHTITYVPMASGLAEVKTELVVPPTFKPVVDKVFGGASPLTANTVLNFDGSENTTFTSPNFSTKDPIATTSWQGINGTMNVNGTHMVVNATAPGLKVQSPMGNGSLANLAFAGDMTKGTDEVWLGTGSFQVGKFDMSGPILPAVVAEGLRIASDTKEQGPGLLRSKVSMDLKKLTAQDLAFSNLGYEFELTNLDRATLVRLSKAMEKMQPTGAELPPELTDTFMTAMPQLLKRSPTFAVKRLGAVTPWGDFKTNALLSFDGKGDLPKEPVMWLNRVSLEAKVDISAGLLRWALEQQLRGRTDLIAKLGDKPLAPEETQQLVATLAAVRLSRLAETGAVVANDDRYTIEVMYKEGHLALNGKDPQEIVALME